MKILNLFAGIGGNRGLWENCEVTAVEIDPEIACIYKKLYPQDKVIVGDAKEYLINHFNEFDFIWASPPCVTHSRIKKVTSSQAFFQDMTLWQIILFLQNFAKCDWIVENVITFYKPLINPTALIDSHYFWSNFLIITNEKTLKFRNHNGKLKDIAIENKIDYKALDCFDFIKKRKVLRNCVNPETGKQILDYVKLLN